MIKVESSQYNVPFHYEIIAIRKGYLNNKVELDINDPDLSKNERKVISNINSLENKNKKSKKDLKKRMENDMKIKKIQKENEERERKENDKLIN